MDSSAFIHWLQAVSAEQRHTAKNKIIHFQHPAEYQQCVRLLSESARMNPQLGQIKPMPLIQALSCCLADNIPETNWGSIWIEEDESVTVHSSVKKTLQPAGGIPWGVQQVKAPAAWSRTTGHSIRIGVIDTGVDFNHPDLRPSLTRGINLLNRSSMPYDDNGHGTHIAGTIAAANQPKGMIGVAPRSTISPVKAFDHNGSAYVSDIILGIDWCVRNRLHIINMSFGMKSRSKALLNAVTNAYNSGVIIVASSGNDSKRKAIDYPARYPQTISVGATNRVRRIAPFSNRGSHIDIYAPGDKIISAWLRGKYHEMSGTSMATSHVSGAVALLLARYPGLGPHEIKSILKRSMQPLRGNKAPKVTGELDIMKMLRTADNEAR